MRSAGRDKPGYTLMEVLLALAVMVAIVALAWPVISGVADIYSLRNAGRTIRAEWKEAQVQARTTGKIYVFRFETGTNRYTISPLPDPEFPVDEMDEPDQDTRAPAGSPLGPAELDSLANVQTLPEDIRFEFIDLGFDERRAIVDGPDSGVRFGDTLGAPPVIFYPDGTTSIGKLTLRNARKRRVDVTIGGLTGDITVGEPYEVTNETDDGWTEL